MEDDKINIFEYIKISFISTILTFILLSILIIIIPNDIINNCFVIYTTLSFTLITPQWITLIFIQLKKNNK